MSSNCPQTKCSSIKLSNLEYQKAKYSAVVLVSYYSECVGYKRAPCESHEDFLSWGRFLFQNSLGGMSTTMIGGAEQGARCIQIIHFGIADSPKWPPLPFPLLTVMSLHPQTLSLAGIISKPFKICAMVIFSPHSGKVALIAQTLFVIMLTSNWD